MGRDFPVWAEMTSYTESIMKVRDGSDVFFWLVIRIAKIPGPDGINDIRTTLFETKLQAVTFIRDMKTLFPFDDFYLVEQPLFKTAS